MSVMFVLILASLIVAVGFLFAFLWAVKSGQFDDKYTPSVRILFDDQPVKDSPESSASDSVSDTQPMHSLSENEQQEDR